MSEKEARRQKPRRQKPRRQKAEGRTQNCQSCGPPFWLLASAFLSSFLLIQRRLDRRFESCFLLEIHKVFHDGTAFIDEKHGREDAHATVSLLHLRTQMGQCEIESILLRVIGADLVVVR